MKRGAFGLLAAALALAAFWTLRLGYADWLYRRGTPDQVRRAARLVPANARYHAALSDPARALAANPRDSASWIELALAAEMADQPDLAERRLTEAARVDRQYDPAWSLANFYFRRSDPAGFWRWAERAASLSYPAPEALFRLCHRVDPSETVARIVSPRPQIQPSYLRFLLRDGELEDAGRAAVLLAGWAGAEHAPLLLETCDRLLDPRYAASALALWNILCRRGIVAGSPLDPASGRSLTNAAFRQAPLARGFDWRPNRIDGVRLARHPGGLAIDFSGGQPEECEILGQYFPPPPGMSARVRSDLKPGVGLEWRVYDPCSGSRWGPASGCGLARLALAYRRPAGSVRLVGTVLLGHVELEP